MHEPNIGEMEPFLISFLRSLKAANLSKDTIRNYRQGVEQFGVFLVGNGHSGDPAKVTREDVEDFIVLLLDTRSASTAATRYRGLQQFFRWLRTKENEIDVSPMQDMDPPKVDDKHVNPFSFEEREALLATVPKTGRDFVTRRDRAIIMCLIDAGMRLGELAGMEVDHWNDSEQRLRIWGKTGARTISLGDTATQALNRYLRSRRGHPRAAGTDLLWLGPKGPLTDWGLYQVVKRRARQAGVKGVHPHRFRHTAAHFWLVRGGAEVDLMAHMGWSTMQMVQRYTKSAAEARAQGVHLKLALGDEHA